MALQSSAVLCCAYSLGHVRLFATPWTVAHQASLSMGSLQARLLEWVAMTSSRGSSQPKDWTQVSCTTGGFFTVWATKGRRRILQWVAYPFSRGTSWPRNRTRVSYIAGGFFTSWATWEALSQSLFSQDSLTIVKLLQLHPVSPIPINTHNCWLISNSHHQHHHQNSLISTLDFNCFYKNITYFILSCLENTYSNQSWRGRQMGRKRKKVLILAINVSAVMELVFYEFTLWLAYFITCKFKHEKEF